ncbi:MAG: NYN domain-containing protein [Oscillospiraceae bacterium]|nr:NYN domain-containing protein [Oscillospiraceae bacterium]
MKYIFIDGYNVINSWKELKELKKTNYGLARSKLIELLENYSSINECKIQIVFDAYLSHNKVNSREEISRNLIIVFTKEGETADTYIEKTINKIGGKYNTCVVTSDNIEKQVVFKNGASTMTSEEFYHEVEFNKNKIRKKINKNYSDNKIAVEDIISIDIIKKLKKLRDE